MKQYFEIINIISEELLKVDEEIERIIKSFPSSFTANFLDFVLSNSKKIRSVMAILYLKALNNEVSDKQIKICAVIELLHNASLIHDDVVDDAHFRRNKPSFKNLYGNKKAVLSGDFLLSLCLKEISLLNNSVIIEDFAVSMLKICSGEIFQLENLGKITTIEEYVLKSEQKTAELFKLVLKSVLIIDNNLDYIEKATELARNFGTAFQIKNDLLNYLENGENNDLQNGIYTAPVIFAQNPSKAYNGIEKTKSLLNNYLSNAQNVVSDLNNSKYKTAINELLELYRND